MREGFRMPAILIRPVRVWLLRAGQGRADHEPTHPYTDPEGSLQVRINPHRLVICRGNQVSPREPGQNRNQDIKAGLPQETESGRKQERTVGVRPAIRGLLEERKLRRSPLLAVLVCERAV